MTSRAGCRCGLLTECPLVPNDPAPSHADIDPELVRDGPIGEPFGAQPVGERIEIGAALAGHGRPRKRGKKPYAAISAPPQVYWSGIPLDAPAVRASQRHLKFE